MADTTGISWTDSTFNPWWGCRRVSPGCEHCYAEAFARRFGVLWGPKAERRPSSEKVWAAPRAWNLAAATAGVRRRVFCASMADVFEDRRDLDAPRSRLFALITETPWLDWQLLTKRPENMLALVPASWADRWPRNVWAGCTVEDQANAEKRIPHLRGVPAAVRFLSLEPLLGPVDLTRVRDLGAELDLTRMILRDGSPALHWLIVGGESGPGARPFNLRWAASLVAQGKAAGIPTFVKQLGARAVVGSPGDLIPLGLADRKGGDMDEWPADLRVRQFPEGAAP